MSETLPDTQLAALERKFDALFAAVEELKKANTSAERQEAKEDVESAESALQRYAKAHGISQDEAEEAMANVKRRAQVTMVKEALRDLTDEDWDEIFPPEQEEASEEKTARKKPASKKQEEEKPPKQEEDSAPGGEHWTDRKLFT